MIWLVLLVAVVLVVVTVAAVLGRVDGSLADATTSMSHVPLPEDRLTPDDIDGLRFDTAIRGYRMSEVDAVVDRLRREIVELRAELDGGVALDPARDPAAAPAAVAPAAPADRTPEP